MSEAHCGKRDRAPELMRGQLGRRLNALRTAMSPTLRGSVLFPGADHARCHQGIDLAVRIAGGGEHLSRVL